MEIAGQKRLVKKSAKPFIWQIDFDKYIAQES